MNRSILVRVFVMASRKVSLAESLDMSWSLSFDIIVFNVTETCVRVEPGCDLRQVGDEASFD